MKTAIFDLDGTLADTSGDLIAAANECFRELGFDVPLDGSNDQLLAFRGGRAMLREGYRRLTGNSESENVIHIQYRRLLEHYEDAIDHCSILYPAVESALETMQKNGWRLSVCTNKPERLARLLLEKLGIGPMFGALVGGDTLPVCKPNPAPVRKVVEMVGGDLGKSYSRRYKDRFGCCPVGRGRIGAGCVRSRGQGHFKAEAGCASGPIRRSS